MEITVERNEYTLPSIRLSTKARKRSKTRYSLTLQPKVLLPLLFLLTAGFHFALSYLTSTNPTVYIDEGLYINLARSIYTDGKVMFRAQPVQYVYLLYPMVLLPLFALPAGVNLYRAIQLYNALMMASSVFPAYLIGKKMGLSKTGIWVVVLLTLLIPETCLSTHLTAEALLYPLMMWNFVLAVDICAQQQKGSRYVALGMLTGLLYFIKPVCIIFGVCFLLVLLLNGCKRKERVAIQWSILGLIAVGAVIGVGYAAYHVLFGAASVMNLYEKQIPTLDWRNIGIMAQGFVFHIAAIVFGTGGVYVLMPLIGRKKLPGQQQTLLETLVVAIISSCVGIAILIVPFNFTGSLGTSAVHLRDLMYYFPLMAALLLDDRLKGVRPSKMWVIVMAFFAVFFIFPSPFHMVPDNGIFDAPSLNAYYGKRAGKTLGTLMICILSLATVYYLYTVYKKGWNEKLQKMACIVCAISFLINGGMTYSNRRQAEREVEQDAQKIAQIIADQDVVIVTNNLYDDFRGYLLDTHLHRPAQMVVVNNLLLNAVETNGVYTSFTPLVQAPNTENLPLIDTDTLVFDVAVAENVEFASNVVLNKTKNGYYTVAKIEPGKPFLKSALASLDAYYLRKGDICSLLIFDKDILEKGEVTLTITLRCSTADSCEVTFAAGNESKTVTATRQSQTYEITLPFTENEFWRFTIVSTEELIVNSYTTK